ncbi:MAG: TonB C-terminal domain-containing protein [Candidatus Hydrogenedentes bacterium]|nr:TonB C-terminal domain-containing protein [Candidatus Hydrogenedentota bacterium]
MQWLYYEYWKKRDDTKRIRKAFIISVIVHLLIFVPFLFFKFRTPEAIPLVFQVSLQTPAPETPVPEKPAIQPEPPKPEPLPKPEPPKPEPPKPEPPKQEPPKKPELPKEEKPKQEKKEEPKPEKKDLPKKEDKKPKEEVKPKPPESTPEPKPPEKKQELTASNAMPKAEITSQIPPELEWWARQVQRKIDSVWVVPEGIKVDVENNVAEVSFLVNRAGQLVEPPKVIKEASDPELGESGVRAIMLAVPFPRLPDNYPKDEQLVVYSFSLQ